MSDRIGPTFGPELRVAGCADGVSWCGADGSLLFADAVTDAQRASVQRVLAAHDPTRGLPPTITGNQWAFALAALDLASAWMTAITKSKPKDQVRVGLIARSTPLLATDPLLLRVAANAGADLSGAPVIDIAAVFAKALTEAL